ncbi:T9SS C-terminal target domain-containing protein [Salinibacter sp. 10B]|uniref:T9SS C-terminal target domain-containing protein n=1 Tax=Salinibacter sp. 10B TaxID=1923971 RepID=UPI0011B0E758|nr:T9SS C-terminal target domain-containing protein [Salinibacter sp. 10B]
MHFAVRVLYIFFAAFGLMTLPAQGQSAATYDTTTVDGQKAVVIGTSTAGIAHPTHGPDVTWTSDYVWILDDLVFVDKGQTLRVEPGTVVKGDAGDGADASALVVARGGTIFAEGTAEKPIIFTSIKDDLTTTEDLPDDFRGGWGGVIILGRAPINTAAGLHDIEGVPPDAFRNVYGGDDPSDSSGVLRYVSIRHGGTVLKENEEINGLTLGGVGRGTTIEYVEVFNNKDDGFEWFGGTVDAKHLVSAFATDDSYDIDQGYQGRGQFWLAIQNSYYADHAGEHDGGEANYGGEDSKPYSAPQLYNMTYVGSGMQGTGSTALNLRDNFAGAYHNSMFVDFPQKLVRIEDVSGTETGDSRARFEDGTLQLEGNLFGQIAGSFVTGKGVAASGLVVNDGAFGERVADYLADNNTLTGQVPLQTLSRSSRGFLRALDPRPTQEALVVSGVPEPRGDFFEAVDYIGAFGEQENWARSWTYVGRGGSEYPGLGLIDGGSPETSETSTEQE